MTESTQPARRAVLHTNHGDIAVNLFPDHAPKTVANFADLAEGRREWTHPETRRKSPRPFCSREKRPACLTARWHTVGKSGRLRRNLIRSGGQVTWPLMAAGPQSLCNAHDEELHYHVGGRKKRKAPAGAAGGYSTDRRQPTEPSQKRRRRRRGYGDNHRFRHYKA